MRLFRRSQPTLKYKLRQVYLGVGGVSKRGNLAVGGGAVSRLSENESRTIKDEVTPICHSGLDPESRFYAVPISNVG